MFDRQHEQRIEQLKKAVRDKAWIGQDRVRTEIKDMDDRSLLKAYRKSLSWYSDVSNHGEHALDTILAYWNQVPHTPSFASNPLDIPNCCFEQEADYVLSAVETARKYVLALNEEIVRRGLQGVFEQMSKTFGHGRRGWHNRYATTAH